MQPLISPVDHESRHNLYCAEDGHQQPSEDTPLLQQFPRTDIEEGTNPITTVMVTFLLLTLISGVFIGIYLLVIQNNSENILPPVERPLQLVSRTQWAGAAAPALAAAPFKAQRVVVVQTNTRQCTTVLSCAKLLHTMQNTSKDGLPYNFLVSSSGLTFEALGWRHPSPLFEEYPSSLVLAFIGNFTEMPPNREQLDEAEKFFAESISLQHLDSTYAIIGKSTGETPRLLFKVLKHLPQYNTSLSDSE